MSAMQIKDERVDARILEATLTREDVATALYEFVCRRAKVDDYEVETLDMAKSTFGLEFRGTGGQVFCQEVERATVTVRLDTSRLPKSMPAAPLPSVKDLETLILEWGTANGRISTAETVDKIRDLCR